jgi:hypothetical protein
MLPNYELSPVSAVFVGYLDRTVRSPLSVSALLAWKVTGSLPYPGGDADLTGAFKGGYMIVLEEAKVTSF